MKRMILDETVQANVTLRKTGPRSYSAIGRVFLPGRMHALTLRSEIQACLNIPHFRVVQFNEAGEKLADTDSEQAAPKAKPLSVRTASSVAHGGAEPIPAMSAAEKIARLEQLEAEMLAEEQAAKAAKLQGSEPPSGKVDEWSVAMKKSELAEVLRKATGQDVDEQQLTKREIVEALEALEALNEKEKG